MLSEVQTCLNVITTVKAKYDNYKNLHTDIDKLAQRINVFSIYLDKIKIQEKKLGEDYPEIKKTVINLCNLLENIDKFIDKRTADRSVINNIKKFMNDYGPRIDEFNRELSDLSIQLQLVIQFRMEKSIQSEFHNLNSGFESSINSFNEKMSSSFSSLKSQIDSLKNSNNSQNGITVDNSELILNLERCLESIDGIKNESKKTSNSIKQVTSKLESINKEMLVRHEELKEGIVKSNDKLLDNMKNYMDIQTEIIKSQFEQQNEENRQHYKQLANQISEKASDTNITINKVGDKIDNLASNLDDIE